jgi:plasmid stabilization system protein ParE
VSKKYNIQITATAQTDIGRIWDYSALDARDQIAACITRLEKSIISLADYPERNPLIPENILLNTQYRHVILDNYRIIYRMQPGTVWVVRILHGAI